MSNEDYLLALQIQNALDNKNDKYEKEKEKYDKYQRRDLNDLNSTNNLVHPDWEVLDPTPDIHSMFGVFDMKFFQGKLKFVELEWSKRMYSCAGICYQRKNRFGMSCIIRLSQPLLILRPRKNLVETLLHEMIHAYLFVNGIHEGNGGHGPNFKNIMYGINKLAGTNITVYHTFIDEIEIYKTHWWRCNGICQQRKPFYGYVKRTSNRAPSSNDRWWMDHQMSCGGTFVKIKEPDKKKGKSNGDTNVPVQKATKDIRTFFPNYNKNKINEPINVPGSSAPSKINHGTKPVIQKPITSNILKDKKSDNRHNVFGLKDLNSSDENEMPKSTKPTRSTFTGFGKPLGGETILITSPVKIAENSINENIRNIWSKRFPPAIASTPIKTIDLSQDQSKRRKISEKNDFVVRESENNWKLLNDSDDDLFIEENIPETIDLSGNSVTNIFPDEIDDKKEIKLVDRHQMIKEELFDSDDDMDSIILIDDEYNDNLNDNENLKSSVELADASVIDDLFSDDTLMTDFVKTSSNMQQTEHHYSGNGIIACPVCQQNMIRDNLASHMEGCLGIVIKIEAPTKRGRVVNDKPCTSTSVTHKTKLPFYKTNNELLKEAGYSDSELLNISTDNYIVDISEENDIKAVQDIFQDSNDIINLTADDSLDVLPEKTSCPVCNQFINLNQINEHLDKCLIIDD